MPLTQIDAVRKTLLLPVGVYQHILGTDDDTDTDNILRKTRLWQAGGTKQIVDANDDTDTKRETEKYTAG